MVVLMVLNFMEMVKGDRKLKYRNEIELKLTNTDKSKMVDLGKFKTLDAENKKLGSIKPGETNSMVLSGVAGTKLSDDATTHSTSDDVDSKGASENFNLVFEIKKTK
ncbi:MAG: hypothetical protein U0Z74_04950 [Romboutsia timonensis]